MKLAHRALCRFDFCTCLVSRHVLLLDVEVAPVLVTSGLSSNKIEHDSQVFPCTSEYYRRLLSSLKVHNYN